VVIDEDFLYCFICAFICYVSVLRGGFVLSWVADWACVLCYILLFTIFMVEKEERLAFSHGTVLLTVQTTILVLFCKTLVMIRQTTLMLAILM